jgi:LysR family transcriptional activator of glutamate synthase operon
MGMDVTALRWFQQVADGTTVTEVSELAGVTQSGVSRALARLDAEIGFPLLVRSGRTLRMSRAGATFKRHVDRLLHELDDGLAALSELASPDSGTVSVAFQLSLGTWLVPHLVAGFRARHPEVQFDLHQLRDEISSPRLLAGTMDLELTTVTGPDEPLKWRPLLVEPLCLIVPRDHRLAGGGPVSLAEVSEERFVMLRTTYQLRRTCEELCRQARFSPDVAFEGDDLSTVAGLVGAGLGVAIVPALRDHRAADGAPVSELGISDPGASQVIGIAWSTERRLLPAAERFRQYVLALSRSGALEAALRRS